MFGDLVPYLAPTVVLLLIIGLSATLDHQRWRFTFAFSSLLHC